MTRDEAKLALQACRAHGQDARLPAIREALALVAHDPELQAWWEAEQAFDRAVIAKLDEIAPPDDVRETILALEVETGIPPRTRRRSNSAWLTLAALFIALAVAGFLVWPFQRAQPPVATDSYNEALLQSVQTDPSLPFVSHDQQQIFAWLKARGGPTGIVPPNTAALPSVGCETLAIHGQQVSLICFTTADGQLIHLFIIDRAALQTPPADHPEWSQKGDWATVAWSDNSRSYLLATRAGMPTLKSLL